FMLSLSTHESDFFTSRLVRTDAHAREQDSDEAFDQVFRRTYWHNNHVLSRYLRVRDLASLDLIEIGEHGFHLSPLPTQDGDLAGFRQLGIYPARHAQGLGERVGAAEREGARTFHCPIDKEHPGFGYIDHIPTLDRQV